MKTINILLDLLLNECISSRDFYGMCVSAYHLYYRRDIKLYEMRFLNEYIKQRQPDVVLERGFWWEVGVKHPRIEWLKKQIKIESS